MCWLSLGSANALEVNSVPVNVHATSPKPTRFTACLAVSIIAAGKHATGLLAYNLDVHLCRSRGGHRAVRSGLRPQAATDRIAVPSESLSPVTQWDFPVKPVLLYPALSPSCCDRCSHHAQHKLWILHDMLGVGFSVGRGGHLGHVKTYQKQGTRSKVHTLVQEAVT